MTALKGFIFRSALPGLALLLLLGACSLPNKVGKGAPAPVHQGTADGIGGADPFTTYLYSVRDNVILPAVDDLLAGRYAGNPCSYQACSGPEAERPRSCRRAPVLSVDQEATCLGLLEGSLLALRAKLQDPAVTLLGRQASFQTATANPLMRTRVTPTGVIEASQTDIEALALDSYEVAAVLVHEYLHKLEGALNDSDVVGAFSGPLGGSSALTAVGFAVALQAAAPALTEPAPVGEPAVALALLRFDDVTAVDFGTRVPGSLTVRRIVLRNVGDGAATGLAVAALAAPYNQSSGSCFSTAALAPQATCEIDVKFQASGEGDFFGSFEVSYHNQATGKSLLTPVYGKTRIPHLFVGQGGFYDFNGGYGKVALRSLTDGSAPARFPQGHVPFTHNAATPRIAVGDLNGDGRKEIVVASGRNAGGEIRIYDSLTGNPYTGVKPPVRPFGEFYGGGLYVAVGDVDGDKKDDVVVGSGYGIQAEGLIYSGADGQLIRSIKPFGEFGAGINVAAGDVNRDGAADVVFGADTSGGPHVRLYDGANGNLLSDGFVYHGNFTGGVSVALGDVTGDGVPELITGAGWWGGPHLRVLDALTRQPVGEFMAYADELPDGIRVTSGDVNGDGRADLIVGPYRGSRRPMRVFSGADFSLIREIPVATWQGPLKPTNDDEEEEEDDDDDDDDDDDLPADHILIVGPDLYPHLGHF